jgi:hypothetical protein
MGMKPLFLSIDSINLCVITLAELKFNVYILSRNNINLNIHTKICPKMDYLGQ